MNFIIPSRVIALLSVKYSGRYSRSQTLYVRSSDHGAGLIRSGNETKRSSRNGCHDLGETGPEPASRENNNWPGTMHDNAAGEAMKKRPIFGTRLLSLSATNFQGSAMVAAGGGETGRLLETHKRITRMCVSVNSAHVSTHTEATLASSPGHTP